MICARAVPEFSWVRTGGDEAERSGHTFLSATAQQGCLRSGYIHRIATPACRISEYVTGTTAPGDLPDDLPRGVSLPELASEQHVENAWPAVRMHQVRSSKTLAPPAGHRPALCLWRGRERLDVDGGVLDSVQIDPRRE